MMVVSDSVPVLSGPMKKMVLSGVSSGRPVAESISSPGCCVFKDREAEESYAESPTAATRSQLMSPNTKKGRLLEDRYVHAH